jgi:hypothetical protein
MRPTLTFDNDTRVENNPRPEELAWINACPRFVSDAQWVESEANDVYENAAVVME